MAMKREQETIICAADPASLEGVPREVKILPLGRVQSMKGTFEVDDESCRTIMAQFKGRHLDLVIDYEHQTLKDVQAPAGGWIKDIYKGDDALVAKVEWTPKAPGIPEKQGIPLSVPCGDSTQEGQESHRSAFGGTD